MVQEVVEWPQLLVNILDMLITDRFHNVLVILPREAVVNFSDVRVDSLPEIYLYILDCLCAVFHDDLRRWQISVELVQTFPQIFYVVLKHALLVEKLNRREFR